MLHPSYTELIRVVNSENEANDTPVVNSRYSIVLATAKRARQIIDGSKPLVNPKVKKPLSAAVEELQEGLIKICPETAEEEETLALDELSEETAAEDGMESVVLDEIVEDMVEDTAEDQLEG